MSIAVSRALVIHIPFFKARQKRLPMPLEFQVASLRAQSEQFLPLSPALSGRDRKVKGINKTLAILALGLWLALGTVLPARAQLTLPHGSADYPCDQPAGSAEPDASAGHAVMATIKGVDRQRGILELETTDGRAVIASTPGETRGLQEGDEMLVCLEGGAIGGEERLAAPRR
jgi:hypothetical protein